MHPDNSANPPSGSPGEKHDPGGSQTGENTCPVCAGSGKDASGSSCPECGGTGKVIEIVGDA